MAYSEYLVERVRLHLKDAGNITDKKMMGGWIFMLDEKMVAGVDKDKKTGEDRLMLRVGKDHYENYLSLPGCRLMDFTGKPMKGFVFVYPEGFDMDEDLNNWLNRAVGFVKGI